MNKKCKNCNKEFEARTSRAKYCSANCRVEYYRNKKDVTESKNETERDKNVTETFIPNWKRKGLKSREEVMPHLLKDMVEKFDCPFLLGEFKIQR